jgi:monoamine oxidase
LLDKDYEYTTELANLRRGFDKPPGGGPDGAPTLSDKLARPEIMKSGLAQYLSFNMLNDFQTTMFQPVGGMDMIGRAFGRQVNDLVTHNVKVTSIRQDDQGVTVTYADNNVGGAVTEVMADYCVCTIPLPVLSQLDVQVSDELQQAIAAVPYASSVKIGRAYLWRHHLYRFADQRDVLSQPRLFRARPCGDAGRLYVRPGGV